VYGVILAAKAEISSISLIGTTVFALPHPFFQDFGQNGPAYQFKNDKISVTT